MSPKSVQLNSLDPNQFPSIKKEDKEDEGYRRKDDITMSYKPVPAVIIFFEKW